MLGRATGNTDTQDSSWPGLGGSHHLPPYSILCASPWGPHPNGFLFRDSQVEVPKLSKLGLLWLWGPITLFANLQLRWGLKQSYSPCRDLFNNMSHATCTQGNWVDSWLLMVESQIANLTPGPNLCFRCPNGWCKPILDIYVPIAFQWYKGLFEPLGFDPCNCSLDIRESSGTLTPKVEAPLGVWGFIPSHFPSLFPSLSGLPFGSQPCKALPWSRSQG